MSRFPDPGERNWAPVIEDYINSIVGFSSEVSNVLDYGATGDGFTDDTTAITAANTAAHVAGGVVYFPPGTYVNTDVQTISKTTVRWLGESSAATTIQHNGTGDCVRIFLASFTVAQAGSLSGMTINGTASANGAGVHMSDTIGFGFNDVVIQNFTHSGGSGLWLDNIVQFIERTTAIRLHLNGNTKGLRFTVNGGNASFSYNRWLDVKLNLESGQIGISAENNSYVFNNYFNFSGNVNGSGGNTASVVTLSDTAWIDHGTGVFQLEQTTGSGAKFLTCPASTVFVGQFFISPGDLARSLGGTVTIGNVIATVALASPGAVTIDASQFAATNGLQQVFLQANATSSSITNPLSGQILTIAWLQDGAGGHTVSWPANMLFASGTAPAQASATNKTTITVYYDGASWCEMSRSVNVG